MEVANAHPVVEPTGQRRKGQAGHSVRAGNAVRRFHRETKQCPVRPVEPWRLRWPFGTWPAESRVVGVGRDRDRSDSIGGPPNRSCMTPAPKNTPVTVMSAPVDFCSIVAGSRRPMVARMRKVSPPTGSHGWRSARLGEGVCSVIYLLREDARCVRPMLQPGWERSVERWFHLSRPRTS